MLTIFYWVPQLWASFSNKLMKRPILFFQYFKTSTFPLCVHKISWPSSYKKIYLVCFNMWIKTCSFHQLWTIFSTIIMKNSTICVTCFSSLFQILHCDAVLLCSHICNKNGSCFSFANKMLFISNGIFFTHCLQFLFLFTVYFHKYLEFALGTITHWQNYVTENIFVE